MRPDHFDQIFKCPLCVRHEMKSATLTASTSPFLADDAAATYIYHVLQISNSHLATVSSDDSLRLIDPNTLQEITGGTFQHAHNGITSLQAVPNFSTELCTAGRDGTVKLWDTRSRGSTMEFRDGMQTMPMVPIPIPRLFTISC